jgi:hypothetical protein
MRRSSASVLLACVASFALAGCAEVKDVTGGWWNGSDHYFVSARRSDEWSGHERNVVSDAAKRSLACPAVDVEQPYGNAWVATGCGRRTTLLVVLFGPNRAMKIPGFDDEVWPSWARAIDLVKPQLPEPLPYERNLSETPFLQAQRWIDLVAAGARDLQCPADQVTPDIVPQGKAPALPIVEGCGKRATYVSEDSDKAPRLSSLVPIAS